MIALASEWLLFRMAGGESIPFSAEMISVELMGEAAEQFDLEFVRHAAKAVFHYFKHDLRRHTVSVSEFARALEKALRGLALAAKAQAPPASPRRVESDLRRLACESGKGCELFFFARLRDEMRSHLRQAPGVLCYRNLRSCVKQLAGARRWSARCQQLRDQIVDFLRQSLTAEAGQASCALVVH